MSETAKTNSNMPFTFKKSYESKVGGVQVTFSYETTVASKEIDPVILSEILSKFAVNSRRAYSELYNAVNNEKTETTPEEQKRPWLTLEEQDQISLTDFLKWIKEGQKAYEKHTVHIKKQLDSLPIDERTEAIKNHFGVKGETGICDGPLGALMFEIFCVRTANFDTVDRQTSGRKIHIDTGYPYSVTEFIRPQTQTSTQQQNHD